MFLGSGWLLYSGAVGQASQHKHHALQVLVARVGAAHLEGRTGACRGVAVAVAADTAHAMPLALPSAYLLYLESDSKVVRRFGWRQAFAMHAFAPGAEALAELLSEPESRQLEAAHRIAERIVELLAPAVARDRQQPRHPSVRRAISLLPDLIAEHGSDLRLPIIAAAVGRSPEGLSRTFNSELGMSIPAYVRWARLRFVARALARGRALTEAAQEAGFSDSAHLSRVFRATFGVRPSELATCAHWAIGDVELG